MVRGMPAAAAPGEPDAGEGGCLFRGYSLHAQVKLRREPDEPGVGVSAVYLILLGLGVPALTFNGLWFWRLRHQRHADGHLSESEMATRIAARQAELRQEREARDERLAALIAHLLQSTAGTRSDVHAIQDAVERALRK
jgi:hypothetical protein